MSVIQNIVFSLVVVLLFSSLTSAEEGLLHQVSISLVLADKAAAAALKKCEEDGYKVSVSVVDRSGTLKVLLRGDSASPHTIDSSRKKPTPLQAFGDRHVFLLTCL